MTEPTATVTELNEDEARARGQWLALSIDQRVKICPNGPEWTTTSSSTGTIVGFRSDRHTRNHYTVEVLVDDPVDGDWTCWFAPSELTVIDGD